MKDDPIVQASLFCPYSFTQLQYLCTHCTDRKIIMFVKDCLGLPDGLMPGRTEK
jgi:hypothetical protein